MKKWIRSKTLWINLIAIGAIIIQCEFGFAISPKLEAMALVIINLILRSITNEGLKK